jgi:hypothetical protein
MDYCFFSFTLAFVVPLEAMSLAMRRQLRVAGSKLRM